MKYFKCTYESYDYFTKQTAIEGEIYTPKQRNRMFPHLPDNYFEKVEVKKTDTYVSFGCRFISEDAKVNSWIYTKEQAEHIICEHMREIKRIAQENYPSDVYTTLCFIHGQTMFNNSHFNPIEIPIDYHSARNTHPSNVEFEILKVLARINDVFYDYCPEGDFFDMCINSEGDIFFFNEYWKKNVIHKLCYYSWEEEV